MTQQILAAFAVLAAVAAKLLLRSKRETAVTAVTEAEAERPGGAAAEIARQVRDDIKAGKKPQAVSEHAQALAEARWSKAQGKADA